MIELLLLVKAPIIGLALLFWYKTNFVWTYGKIFGLTKILRIDKFEEKLKFNPDLTYQMFIAMNYSGFIARLLSCSVCLATWFSIIICFSEIALTDSTKISILMIPANAFFGIIYFFTAKKLT